MTRIIWNKVPQSVVYSSEMAKLYSEFDSRNFLGFNQFIIKGYSLNCQKSPDNKTLNIEITSGTGKCENIPFSLLYNKESNIISPLIESSFTNDIYSTAIDLTKYGSTIAILALPVIQNTAVNLDLYTLETEIVIVDTNDPYYLSLLPFTDIRDSNKRVMGRMVLGLYDVASGTLNQNIEIRLDKLLSPDQNIISVTRIDTEYTDKWGQVYRKGVLIAPSYVYPGCTGILLSDTYAAGDNTYVIKFHETKQLTKGIRHGLLNLPIITQPRSEFDNKTGIFISKYNPTTANSGLFICDDGTAMLMAVPANCPINDTISNLEFSMFQPRFEPLTSELIAAGGLGIYKAGATSGNAYYLLSNNGRHYSGPFL